MTPEQALQFLFNLSTLAQAPKATHVEAEKAAQLIAEALKKVKHD